MPVYGTLEQKKLLQKHSNIKVLAAVAFHVLYMVLVSVRSPSALILALLFALCGLVFWIAGAADYAGSKGYPRYYCALGIFTCLGLFVLIVLPNRFIVEDPKVDDAMSNYPR